MRVRVRGSARVRDRVRGGVRVRDRVRASARVRDRAIRSKTAEVLGAKTPATKKQKNKITKWAKRTKRKGKKTQPTISATTNMYTKLAPTRKQSTATNRTHKIRNSTAKKTALKKKATKKEQQFRLKNNKQNKNNAEKTAKPRHDIYQAKAHKKTATKQCMRQ